MSMNIMEAKVELLERALQPVLSEFLKTATMADIERYAGPEFAAQSTIEKASTVTILRTKLSRVQRSKQLKAAAEQVRKAPASRFS